MTMNGSFLFVIRMSVILLLWSAPAFAGSGFDNTDALKGLTEAKVYFDVSLDNPDKLLNRMDLIERTLTQLKQDGLAVKAVIGFRAGASRYITAGDHYVLDEDIAAKMKIGEWIQKFAAQHIPVEQCSIAAAQQDIAATDFLPEVTVVQNGFVSLIGYQIKGFAVVPIN